MLHRLALAIVFASTVPAMGADSDAPRPIMEGPLAGWAVHDLSHALHDDVPVYPNGIGFELKNVLQLEAGFYMNKIVMGEHCGTHIDAPSHKSRNGRHLDQLPASQLYGPLVVLDVSAHAKTDPDYAVSAADIRAYERVHGEILPGSFVIANTGWAKKWSDPKAYVNLGADGSPHFPAFGADAAIYLTEDRKAAGMGTDTLSTDVGISKDFPQHRIFLNAGGVNLENLTNLDGLPPRGAYLLISPIKVSKGSGGPARVLAFVPHEKQ